MINPPACYCGAVMVLKTTEKHTYKSGKPRRFWSCTDPECDGLVGAHPNGRPLGTPESKRVRALRRELHDILGRFWNYENKAERREMYSFLKHNAPKPHIGQMNEEELIITRKLLEGGEHRESQKNGIRG